MLYELHELVQAHSAYLSAMKVIHVYESRPKKQIASAAYEGFLNLISERETTTVDFVVQAMLYQVELTLKAEDEYFNGQTGMCEKNYCLVTGKGFVLR